MNLTTYDKIVTPPLSKGAILNNEFQGFREDYLILHCLLRLYMPKTVLEIGTNKGMGTLIIKNALPNSKVYSLDLPPEQADARDVGSKCYLEYEQIYSDSLEFDYSLIHHLEGAYIDGKHVRKNVYHESKEMIKADCKIIIYHDSDIPEIFNGITDSHEYSNYKLYKVESTRIAYAIRNN